jgi:hypothetical protein
VHKMEIVPIKNKDGLVRDVNSRAVINTNRAEYENYIARKKQQNDMKSRLDQNCKDIDQIKSDMTEVKQMLLALIKQESN